MLEGHCLCGKTVWSVDVDAPAASAHDHCDDCQRQSGSEYSWVGVVPKDKWKVSGESKEYASPGSSGKLVHRVFCSNCGSPLAHYPDAAPDIVAVKMGTLKKEQRGNFAPDTDVWGVGKLQWVAKLKNFNEHMP